MPEGPSITLLTEEAAPFTGKKILRVSGNSKSGIERLIGQRVVALRSWGKHFLIELPDFFVRIHLMLYGRYCIDSRKNKPPRLSLGFARGREMNFYNCSVRFVEGRPEDFYDWSSDTMSELWDPEGALGKLRADPRRLVCDVVLDQAIFSGAGNIFKNEVLFRIRVHPLSRIGALPPKKQQELVDEIRRYAFQFYEWKKAFVLRQYWEAHNKGTCPRCGIRFKRAYLGETNRRSFFCLSCQKKYLTIRRARE